MSKTIFSENLKKARKLKSWTQREASQAIGIKLCTYASYEEGRADPPNKTLTLIVEVFNVQDDVYGFLNNRDFYDKEGRRRKIKLTN
jgi:transcriptional regulator with XRE-family HTH domain